MADSTNPQTFAARLEKLAAAYSKRLDDDFSHLTMLAGQLEEAPSCTQSLQQLHAALHSLSGSAGTFGFEQLGRQAREQEVQVATTLKQPCNEKQPLPVFEWIIALQKALKTDESKKSAVRVETSRVESVGGEPVIWLVERDTILAGYMVQQLHSFGFHIRHLLNAEALAHDKSSSPDLLLIDHRASHLEALRANPVTFWQQHLKEALRRWVWNSPPELGQNMTSTAAGGMTWTAPRF